jgi:hypothetical protein
MGRMVSMSDDMSDDQLERLEHSVPYLVIDTIFNWIGGVGLIILLVYSIRWLHRDSEGLGFDTKFWLWLKVLLSGLILISVSWLKDQLLALAKIAPPSHARAFGKNQLTVGSPEMLLLLAAQQRAARIEDRGTRVDELLAENEAIFLRKQKRLNQ